MIQSLEVKGLNNRDDGNFNFHFHEDLNIFTGANGSGKTTLLKLIWYLTSGHLKQILSEIPFQFVSIETDMFSLFMTRSKSEEPKYVKFETAFNQQEDTLSRFLVGPVDSETGDVTQQEGAMKLNEINDRIARAMKSSLFFPTFRRIEGGFSSPSRYVSADPNFSRRLSPYRTTERLQDALSELSSVVSVYDHKFIASISTEDLGELLTQKYADIYEEITTRQAQVLENISKEIQNNPDKDKVSEIPQDASAVLNAIQEVNEERERLSKPFSVLSELSRKILRYEAIRVTGRIVRGETTDGITLGKGKDGITVGEAGKAKDVISADKLSSGEKQMLSFLCYNAFSENTAIFIDEPELSLHVDWEGIFLPTLLEQATTNQLFVATHSPFIYTMYPDKEFMLDDTRGYQGEI